MSAGQKTRLLRPVLPGRHQRRIVRS